MAWQALPSGMPERWDQRSLFAGPSHWVAATSPAAAEEAYELVEAAGSAWTRGPEDGPGRGLVIAVDGPGELPLADPLAWVRSVTDWHATVVGAAERQTWGAAASPEVPVDLATVAAMASGALPVADCPLGVPPAWLGAVHWVLVVPTRSCIARGVDSLVGAALDAKLGFLARLAVAPLVPVLQAKGRSELEGQVRIRVLEAWFAATGGDRASRVERLRAAIQAAGLDPGQSVVPDDRR